VKASDEGLGTGKPMTSRTLHLGE